MQVDLSTPLIIQSLKPHSSHFEERVECEDNRLKKLTPNQQIYKMSDCILGLDGLRSRQDFSGTASSEASVSPSPSA